MELTIQSALSLGGMVGHLSYLLLVVSMLMRVMWALRVLVILSALVGITYDIFWTKDPVGVFWETSLIVVNVVQLLIAYLQNRSENFTPHESAFVNAAFPGLSNSLKRRILSAGAWREVKEGTKLTTEGCQVDQLTFLVGGQAAISVNGTVVGRCAQGDFVGEVTALTGGKATGSAEIVEAGLIWQIDAEKLRSLVEKHHEIAQAMQASFHRHMLAKLVAANTQLEISGGIKG